jgi:site-specific recombinase XerD
MSTELATAPKTLPAAGQGRGLVLPAIVADAGDRAAKRFVEFFTANIRNLNTRRAYARAVAGFFAWCEQKGVGLDQVEPIHVAGYVEDLGHSRSRPTVKQHLAAIKMLFDWLVVGQVVPSNPAASVRGPKHVVKKGTTPVLTAKEARELLDSIPVERVVGVDEEGRERREPNVVGLRDRALIAVMVYSFARVGAVLSMRVEDYYVEGRRGWFRLHEKGGKLHSVPAHHNAEAYLDAYLEAVGIAGDKKGPLFRTLDPRRTLTARPMDPNDALRMIKRRARAAGLSTSIGCHTFRATGITAYLENGGTIENAQAIAAHESPKTTKLYDRTSDTITLDEVERIVI